MDTELLRAFIAVAECGGFSAAAKRLHRTQSAVSLQIKRLEERLDQTLLRRTSRSVALTDAGGTLLPYARRILELQAHAIGAVEQNTRPRHLRFGLSEEQALAFLPAFLGRFTADHPELHLEVVCDLSTAVIDRLEAGLLDLALTIRHRHTETGEVIAREPLVWVAAEGFEYDATSPLPVAVNPEGCAFRAQGFAALSHRGLDWRVVFTSQNPTGINLAIQTGMAVTIKTPRSVPRGCRILGEAEGLPHLPHVELELHRAPGMMHAAAREFIDGLLLAVARTEGMEMVARASHGAVD